MTPLQANRLVVDVNNMDSRGPSSS